jgi:hypothetical protein
MLAVMEVYKQTVQILAYNRLQKRTRQTLQTVHYLSIYVNRAQFRYYYYSVIVVIRLHCVLLVVQQQCTRGIIRRRMGENGGCTKC